MEIKIVITKKTIATFLFCLISGFLGGTIAVWYSNASFNFSNPFKSKPAVPSAELAAKEVVDPLQAACEKEINQFCKVAPVEEGGIQGCLLEKIHEVNPNCRVQLNPFIEKWRPCVTDVEKYCKDVSIGRGRLAKCLREQLKNLTPSCKAVFK